ncbi:hypothetical protein O2W14_04445 [Modestobacter sp. VKM Ac-2986]|uniref:hypothetical protein n=1 Tax=Modestobacter sp. VKM Ac-2986 TaxID=3004140 RepID=UPI0022AA8EF2|nr:hypothetical protein [Modestobacter sp. VKM Ac-2986]MCZ2828083.1 hypothetical protein [Modestobacter sp. VKM Ac-2986]
MTSRRPHVAAGLGRREAFGLGGAALALTVLAAVVGALGWPSPARTTSGWQVADVPPSLLALLAGAGALCLGVAAVLTRPWQLPAPVAVGWWLVGLLAVLLHGWDSAHLAALADPDGGAVIPVFNWLFTALPALVVGLIARPAGRPAQLRAVLGTAVVGVPLTALSWSLYAAPEGLLPAALGSLWPTAVLGAAPVAAVLALLPRTDPTG